MDNADTLVITALRMAAYGHQGQWRNCGAPYLVHPLDVARRLGRWHIAKIVFPDVWAAAILHDVLEDTRLTVQNIEDQCNPEVARLVLELTFRNKRSDEGDEDYRGAKATYMASFGEKSVKALVIKVSDRLSNVEDYLHDNPRYAVKYWDKAQALFDAMFKRRQEIAGFFGNGVEKAMISDYHAVGIRIEESRLRAHEQQGHG